MVFDRSGVFRVIIRQVFCGLLFLGLLVSCGFSLILKLCCFTFWLLFARVGLCFGFPLICGGSSFTYFGVLCDFGLLRCRFS